MVVHSSRMLDHRSTSSASYDPSDYEFLYGNTAQPSSPPPPASTADQDIEKERDSYIVPGLTGLKNIGNTCYMNATLQCLASLPMFNTYMRKDMYTTRLDNNVSEHLAAKFRKAKNLADDAEVDLKRQHIDKICSMTVTNQLSRLFKYMWKKNCSVVPRTFKNIIGKVNDEFSGFGQNDSQELLNTILDRVHEETKTSVVVDFCNMPKNVAELMDMRTKCMEIIKDSKCSIVDKRQAHNLFSDYRREHYSADTILKAYIYWKKYIKDSHSIITDLFTGMFYSQIECAQGHRSASFEPFIMISVETAPSGETTLEQCLADFSQDEIMQGDEKYNCEQCKMKVDAKKNMYIWEPPEVLIIHLKRFKSEMVSANKARTFKTASKVIFPMNGLSLENNFSDIHNRCRGATYQLWAIVLHKGSCNAGHYIAYCKNPVNKLWYEFNDSTVVHVPDETIEKEVVTENAYVLFYTRER